MTHAGAPGGRSKGLVLTGMIFAGASILCGLTPKGGRPAGPLSRPPGGPLTGRVGQVT